MADLAEAEVEHEDIQKKTFTKWINAKLAARSQPPVNDLFEDLRDGTRLLILLEMLSGVPLKPEIGRMRVHYLNNVNQAIQLLDYCAVKLVNISSDHIVDGNPKMTLGFIWSIIQHWQMEDVLRLSENGTAEASAEKTLLEWCQHSTRGYQHVNVTDFTSSWRDGLAFNALIHHFHPELFDYNKLIGLDSNAVLQHAFTVGFEKLGIVRLLDPEDVSVINPDKKSVMMYLTCCYQVLSREKQTRSQSGGPDEGAADSASSYQNLVEPVLMWLIEAQDTLARQKPIASDAHEVKEQFQEHEEFMVQLTIQQNRIGQILQIGSQLVADSSLADHIIRQIDAQMTLLNDQWEDLRVQAMDRQSSLQQVLTSLQQQQLDKLSAWLTTMESQLYEYTRQGLGTNRASLQQQQEKNRLLQDAVEKEQQYVSSLQNMVVVVDETSSDEAYVALEKQLESLGLRWSSVCRAVEERAVLLENALAQWKNFDSLHTSFSEWLMKTEQTVAQMPSVDSTTDIAVIVEQVRLLKVLEREVVEWIPKYDDLQLRSKQLIQSSDKDAAFQLDEQMQLLRDRWDALVQRMEQRSCEIMQSGIELKVTETGQESHIITVTRKYETQIITKTITLPVLTSTASKQQRTEATEVSVSANIQTSVSAKTHADVADEMNSFLRTINDHNIGEITLNDGSISEASQQLELCQVKLNELLSQKSRLDQINDRVREELMRTTGSSALESELASLNQAWTETVRKLSDYRVRLTQVVEVTTLGSHQEAMAAFVKWIESVEQLLAAEKFVADELDVMEHHLVQYTLLQKDVNGHQTDFDYLKQSSQRLIAGTSPGSDSVKQQQAELQKLQWRWGSIIDAVSKRISAYQSAIDQLKQYEMQTAGIKQWITEMEEFTRPFTEPFSNIDALQQQLKESQAVESDVKKMEASLDRVVKMSQTLMELAGSGPFHEKLRLQAEELSSSFADIVKRLQSHNAMLCHTVDQMHKILESIHQLDVWVDEVTAKNLQQELRVSTKDELSEFETNFRNLTEQISGKQLTLRQINDDVGNLANSPTIVTECEDMRLALTRLNTKWTALQTGVKEASEKVQQFAENYAVFSGLLRDELRWLDQLERKLAAGPRPSGDAEELSEELDELENFVHSQKDHNQTELDDLARSLIAGNVMSTAVTSDLAGYKTRHSALTTQAKQLMVQLEDNIIQAQNRESRILDMSQWMSDINEVLQSRLDADILAGDDPAYYETLKTEFAQHENLLRDLEADIVTFHEQKKLEAAERLEQQTALLKRHFVEVSAKFSKYQRPADFDTKLTHMKRVLDDIDQRLHLIDLTSSDLESVQNKLDQCTKFYRTMSEIKSDVEYVVKTGRQIVEKKQVDFPGTLTSQIDAVKQQYNRIGHQAC